MVAFAHSPDNLFVCVRGCIRMLLSRERDDESGIIVSRKRKIIRMFAARYLNLRPFGPEIYSRRRFNQLHYVRAAYARRGFKKIESSVIPRLYKLRVRNS